MTKKERMIDWLKNNGPATFDEINYNFHGERPNRLAVRNVEQTLQAAIYDGHVVYSADHRYHHTTPKPRRARPRAEDVEMIADTYYQLGDH